MQNANANPQNNTKSKTYIAPIANLARMLCLSNEYPQFAQNYFNAFHENLVNKVPYEKSMELSEITINETQTSPENIINKIPKIHCKTTLIQCSEDYQKQYIEPIIQEDKNKFVFDILENYIALGGNKENLSITADISIIKEKYLTQDKTVTFTFDEFIKYAKKHSKFLNPEIERGLERVEVALNLKNRAPEKTYAILNAESNYSSLAVNLPPLNTTHQNAKKEAESNNTPSFLNNPENQNTFLQSSPSLRVSTLGAATLEANNNTINPSTPESPTTQPSSPRSLTTPASGFFKH